MAKDKKSTFPGSLRDHKDAARAEAEKVSAKIDEAFGKLAKDARACGQGQVKDGRDAEA